MRTWRASRLLALSGAALAGLLAGVVLGQAGDERALMDFFKRHRPARIGMRPKFPYPYDYLYAALLRALPEAEGEHKPGDSRNFAPLEARPGTPEAALRDIVVAWRDGRPELVGRHLDPRTPVACYFKGVYSHLLSPEEFLDFTQVAMSRLRTLSFRFRSPAKVAGERFSAVGVHVFLDPEGKRRAAAVEFSFARVGGNWVIRSVDYGPAGGPRRKRRCPLSSVAFGPGSREVALLTDFRDKCMERSRLGRWVVGAYYRFAPGAADFLERHPFVTRALLRPMLLLLVGVARWAVRASEEVPPTGPTLAGA